MLLLLLRQKTKSVTSSTIDRSLCGALSPVSCMMAADDDDDDEEEEEEDDGDETETLFCYRRR